VNMRILTPRKRRKKIVWHLQERAIKKKKKLHQEILIKNKMLRWLLTVTVCLKDSKAISPMENLQNVMKQEFKCKHQEMYQAVCNWKAVKTYQPWKKHASVK